MTAAIEIDGLRKSYGGIKALDKIDLTVESGENVRSHRTRQCR